MSEKHWSEEELKTRELIAEQAALLDLRGIGVNEQVKQLATEYDLTLTRTRLLTLKKHPKYVESLKKGYLEKIEAGQMIGNSVLAENAKVFADCLVKEAKDGNIKAAIAGLQLLNGKEAEDGPKQAQQLNITLASDLVREIK